MRQSSEGRPRLVKADVWVSLAVCVILSASGMTFSQAEEEGAELPPVYLNHVYIVLDSDTCRAIGESDFLREEFGGFEMATTDADGGESWSGTYCYGQSTYIEFFEPAPDESGMGKGVCGIAFGVEEVGDIDILLEAMKERLDPISVDKQLRTLKSEKGDVPWFHWIAPDYGDEGEQLYSWVMEYHKDFLHTMAPEMYPEDAGISRKVYLSKYFKEGRFFKNITEVRLALEEERRISFLEELGAFGYAGLAKGDGEERTICWGPDIVIKTVPRTDEALTIIELKISLFKKKEGQKVYRFGSGSVLQFGDDLTATWKFK